MQDQKSTYEITDPATGDKWQISTMGELDESDIQNVLRGIEGRPSPRVSELTLTGGKPLAAKKVPAQVGTGGAPPLASIASQPGASGDPLRARFGLDQELSPASAALVRGVRPLGESLKGVIMAPFTMAETVGDIGVQAAQDLAAGRPVLSTDPKSVSSRAQDFTTSLVPYVDEGRAAFTGTEKNPDGGAPALLEVLGKHAAEDPFGVLLQAGVLHGVAKSPAVRTLGDVSKAVMTSMDLSGVGRQGAALAVAHPGRVVPALKDMVKAGIGELGAQEVAARARRPMETPGGGAPPLAAVTAPPPPVVAPTGGGPPLAVVAPITVPKPPRVPTGAPAPPGPTHTVEVPAAQVPQAPPLVQASGEARNTRPVQTSPGVYRVPSEMLDELLNPPTSVAGALGRATRSDALAPVATPGQVAIPDLRAPGSPVAPPVAPGASLGPSLASVAPPVPPVASEPVSALSRPVEGSNLRPSPEALGLDLGSYEGFKGSKDLESIPVIGKLFAPGRRAYDGYLQSLRRGAFDDMAAKLEEQGKTWESDPQALRDAATWVNRLSGSGNPGPIPKPVADLMFAPKLTASRFELLNPRAYLQLDPEVRQVAVRDVLAATGAGLGTLWMASRIPGVKVGTDPEDAATFGKITLPDGKTHYDIWGGMLPYARTAALALKFSDKTGPAVGKRLESMLAPAPSYALDAYRGADFMGKDFDPLGGAVDRFTPLVVQDFRDAIKELGPVGAITASPSTLGVGVQTYQSKKKPSQTGPRR